NAPELLIDEPLLRHDVARLRIEPDAKEMGSPQGGDEEVVDELRKALPLIEGRARGSNRQIEKRHRRAQAGSRLGSFDERPSVVGSGVNEVRLVVAFRPMFRFPEFPRYGIPVQSLRI